MILDDDAIESMILMADYNRIKCIIRYGKIHVV